jgi:hypothetical protein
VSARHPPARAPAPRLLLLMMEVRWDLPALAHTPPSTHKHAGPRLRPSARLLLTPPPPRRRPPCRIADIDKDGSGTIDFDEFLGMMTAKMGERDSKEEIEKAFRLFDDDSTGAGRAARRARAARPPQGGWPPGTRPGGRAVPPPPTAPPARQGPPRPALTQAVRPRLPHRRLHLLQEPEARGQGAGREPDGRGDPGGECEGPRARLAVAWLGGDRCAPLGGWTRRGCR